MGKAGDRLRGSGLLRSGIVAHWWPPCATALSPKHRDAGLGETRWTVGAGVRALTLHHTAQSNQFGRAHACSFIDEYFDWLSSRKWSSRQG